MDKDPLGFPALEGMFQNLVDGAFALAGLVCFVFVIIGGVRYLTSNGDDKEVQSAKNTITYAVVGLLVVVGSFAFFNTLLSDQVLDYPGGVGKIFIHFDIPK